MTPRLLIALLGLCALCASGCASSRQFVPLPDQGQTIANPAQCRIYVLRPQAMVGFGVKMKIKDGKKIIGDLGRKSFLCWERDPGKMTVFLDYNLPHDDMIITMREDLDAQPGAIYYLQTGIINPYSSDGNKLDRLWRVSDEEGKTLLQKCNAPPLASP